MHCRQNPIARQECPQVDTTDFTTHHCRDEAVGQCVGGCRGGTLTKLLKYFSLSKKCCCCQDICKQL